MTTNSAIEQIKINIYDEFSNAPFFNAKGSTINSLDYLITSPIMYLKIVSPKIYCNEQELEKRFLNLLVALRDGNQIIQSSANCERLLVNGKAELYSWLDNYQSDKPVDPKELIYQEFRDDVEANATSFTVLEGKVEKDPFFSTKGPYVKLNNHYELLSFIRATTLRVIWVHLFDHIYVYPVITQ